MKAILFCLLASTALLGFACSEDEDNKIHC